MKSKSFSTTNPDSYEAGVEISDALQEINPEIILLISSIHYNFQELFEGIYSGKIDKKITIFGGTADGFYETHEISNIGISTLAINSEGKIKWEVSIQTGADTDPAKSGQRCAEELLKKMNNQIDTALVLADLKCDGVLVVDGIRNALAIPFVGGLTGDDFEFKDGYVIVNGDVFEKTIAILGLSGDFSFITHTASGWKPTGKMGIVQETQGNTIRLIDGKPAFNFLEEQVGIPTAGAISGVISLAAYEYDGSEHFYLRTPSHIDIENGEVSFLGRIEQDTPVRVCNATQDDAILGVNETITGMGKLEFNPSCIIAISCAARKFLLKERVVEETARIFGSIGRELPLIGMPSFGEIGPFRRNDGSYSNVFFHNVSLVVLLLGDSR